MSRTFRRKNAWNKQDIVNIDRDGLEHMSGANPFPHIQFHRRKYNGCSIEEIQKRIEVKFHSDSMNYRESNRGIKNFGKWWVRFQMKQDLQKAIRLGEEDNLCFDESFYIKSINVLSFWRD